MTSQQQTHSKDGEVDINIPFLNAIGVQVPLFIEAQITNILKAIKAGYGKAFERLAAIAGPLSKTSIVLMGISVLIEDLFLLRNLFNIYVNGDEIAKAEKNKTYLQSVINLLKTATVAIFTMMTFGLGGVLLVMALAAFPLLTGMELIYSFGVMLFNTLGLHDKEKYFQEKQQAFLKMKFDPRYSWTEKETAKIAARTAEIELNVAKESISNERKAVMAKAIVFVGALITVIPVPPVMITGFALVILGFGGLVKTAFSQIKIDTKKEVTLQRLPQIAPVEVATVAPSFKVQPTLSINHSDNIIPVVQEPKPASNGFTFFANRVGRAGAGLAQQIEAVVRPRQH